MVTEPPSAAVAVGGVLGVGVDGLLSLDPQMNCVGGSGV